MKGLVVDTSIWIDFLGGRDVPDLEDALADGLVVLTPVVVAELISGAARIRQRLEIESLIAELELHDTPLKHWIRVGELRRLLATKGLSVSTPDAHVAQCALDRSATLISRDAVFSRIAQHVDLSLTGQDPP